MDRVSVKYLGMLKDEVSLLKECLFFFFLGIYRTPLKVILFFWTGFLCIALAVLELAV